MLYTICEKCGASLDPGERCDCRLQDGVAQMSKLLDTLPDDSPVLPPLWEFAETLLCRQKEAAPDADTSQGGHTKKVIQPDDTQSIHPIVAYRQEEGYGK